ncbi:MAG TPA: hypothetical protein VFF73_25295 [Planctomycetota bacterium]|nr:hypothetical protein [Planctomycetota bacterium]
MRASGYETVLLALLAFASGGASGYFVGRGQARPMGEIPSRRETIDAFERAVGLDVGQCAQAEKILDEYHPRFSKIKMTIEPDLAILRSEVRTQIATILREDQKDRYHAWCVKHDAQRDANIK